MGNRWAKITQENTGTFDDHTEYTTPSLEFDYVDLDAQLLQNNQLPLTSGYSQKRFHWLNALSGRVRVQNYAAADNIGEFLKSIWGSYGVTASIPMYRHKFEPDDAGTAWTIYDYEIGLTNYRKLLGCQATRLEIGAAARDVVGFNWDGIYATEATAALGGTTMGTVPSVRPFVFFDGAVTVEAVQARAESFRVILASDVPEDTQVMGARDRQYLIKQGFTTTAEVDIGFADWTNLRRYYGGSALTEPADEDEVVSCEFTLDGPPSAGAGEYDQYKMLINLPAMVITGHRPSVSRRDRRMETLTLEAIYNANNYIYLYNGVDTYVAA